MYRAGRGRYQSGPTTVPRSMLTPDCQGESHSVHPIIIAPLYEARMKPESRVRDVTEAPLMTTTSPDDYSTLHSRDRLADDGAPALTERFLSYLDARRTRADQTPVPAAALTLDEGRRRLGDEYPDLAACVERCCVGPMRMTTRDAAAALGISAATVCTRKRTGVAQLVVWTGLREETVVAALGYVDRSGKDVRMLE